MDLKPAMVNAIMSEIVAREDCPWGRLTQALRQANLPEDIKKLVQIWTDCP